MGGAFRQARVVAVLLLAGALALWAPASASGMEGMPRSGAQKVAAPAGAQEWMALAQRIALRFWRERGLGRCDRMLPPDGLIPVVWWERGSLVGGHLASALIGTCRADRHFNLFINASESLAERSWLLRCTIVTHEIGHLIGLDHDAPFAVMREADEIPECYKPGQAERRAKRLRSRAKRLERRARKLRSTRAKPARRARLRRRAAKHRRLARRLTGVARAGVAIHGGAWSL